MNTRKIKNYIVQKLTRELPKGLSYHNVQHTLDVLRNCNQYIRRLTIGKKQAYLIRTAALFHDTGFIWTYKDHEIRGVKFAQQTLPNWGYSKGEIEVIGNMIMATSIPQSPQTPEEQILCDADLDYLGTDEFYKTGKTLCREFMHCELVGNDQEWDRLQVKFLYLHSYHTSYAKKHRAPVKEKHLNELLDKWGWNINEL